MHLCRSLSKGGYSPTLLEAPQGAVGEFKLQPQEGCPMRMSGQHRVSLAAKLECGSRNQTPWPREDNCLCGKTGTGVDSEEQRETVPPTATLALPAPWMDVPPALMQFN